MLSSMAVFVGAPGSYVDVLTGPGVLAIQRDGQTVDQITTNFEGITVNNQRLVAFLNTSLTAIDAPPGGTAAHTYTVQTTNGAGYGGLRLVVEELAR
jgi:DNA-binding beta-propeller fold protein YncE